VGTTLGREAEGGSIRGDFSMSQQFNLIHASANDGDAKREIEIVFAANELFDYSTFMDQMVYAEYELKSK
jgi:nucleoside-diphosphate kinase